MACNDSLRLLKEIADSGEAVMIVHRLSGAFLYNSGDLQLGYDRGFFKNENGQLINDVNSYLWRFHRERLDSGDVYRIETHAGSDPAKHAQSLVTINVDITDPGKSGILWQPWQDEGRHADAQRWHIINACEGGIAFVPYYQYARYYVLGLLNRDLASAGCVRPILIFYSGYIPLGYTWELLRESEVDLVTSDQSEWSKNTA